MGQRKEVFNAIICKSGVVDRRGEHSDDVARPAGEDFFGFLEACHV